MKEIWSNKNKTFAPFLTCKSKEFPLTNNIREEKATNLHLHLTNKVFLNSIMYASIIIRSSTTLPAICSFWQSYFLCFSFTFLLFYFFYFSTFFYFFSYLLLQKATCFLLCNNFFFLFLLFLYTFFISHFEIVKGKNKREGEREMGKFQRRWNKCLDCDKS